MVKFVSGIYHTEALLRIVLLKNSFIISLKLNKSITIILFEDRKDEERTSSNTKHLTRNVF